MTVSVADGLAWAADGAAHLRGLMTRMGDDAFAARSALPGWTRAHVLTHVARNADGLRNLLTWARTGVETPMYASQEARDAEIEAGAGRAPDVIREDVVTTSDRLADAVREMPEKAWQATVVARGREMPASGIPWMRAREMWIHAVDLDVGASFADMPAPMVAALLAEVPAEMAAKPDCPALVLADGDRSWMVDGVGRPVTVTGPAPELAAWLLGRSAGKGLRGPEGERTLPALPPWR
jgi:maleylpyruvate isomerase